MPTSTPHITNRFRRIESIRAELAAPFKAGMAADAKIQAALTRYQTTGSPADRDSLASLFLGLVTMMAIRRKLRGAVNSELDDLISDGALGVMRIIERFSHLPAERLFRMICGAIKIGFANGMSDRMWAGGKKKNARDNRTMLTLRSIFLKQHGRMPTGVELRASLDKMIENGQIEKEFTRVHMIPASVAADEDGVDLLAQLGTDGHVGPLYETMDRETMKIALKGLKGIERQMLKLAIEGMSSKRIAEQVGMSAGYVNKRVNGLLWAARCRADLAAHLGTEAETAPVRGPSGNLVSIKDFPPARLVA